MERDANSKVEKESGRSSPPIRELTSALDLLDAMYGNCIAVEGLRRKHADICMEAAALKEDMEKMTTKILTLKEVRRELQEEVKSLEDEVTRLHDEVNTMRGKRDEIFIICNDGVLF